MFRSRRHAAVAAAVVAAQVVGLALATVAARPAAAVAAGTVTCAPAAPVLAADATGVLWRYPLSTASTSMAKFGPRVRIGGGWGAFGTVVSGPDGWVYGIKADGVRAYHFDGTTWDVAGRLISGLGSYASAGARQRITVDELGTFFVLDDAGAVRAYQLDAEHTKFVVAGDLVLPAVQPFDPARNLIVAAGAGVLYTRTTDGSLYRTRYEQTSDRLIGTPDLRLGGGWKGFSNLTSVGGDVLLATDAGGRLLQYRYREDIRTWPVLAHVIGAGGWSALPQVTGGSNGCRLTVTYVPPAVTVTGDPTDAPGVNINHGLVDVFVQGSTGELAWRRLDRAHEGTSLAWITTTVQQVGTPAVSALEDGRAVVMTTSATGRMYVRVQGPGTQTMQPETDEGGLMASSPAAYALRDRMTNQIESVVYAAVDSTGALWTKLQNGSTGELSPWTSTGVSGLSSSAVALSHGITPDDRSAVLMVARTKAGRLAYGLFDGQLMVRWASLGGDHLVGAPAVADLPADFLAVAARDDSGHYQYRWLNRYNDPSTTGGWTQLPDADLVGRPALVVDGGADAIVVARKTSGELALTRRTWNEAGPMSAWTDVPQSEPGTGVTDPAVADNYDYLNDQAQWLMARGGTRPGLPTIVLVQDGVPAPH